MSTPTYEQLQCPYFVYGTLRPGHGNSRLWDDLATVEYDGEAFLPDWGLYVGSLPFAVPTTGAYVVGTLLRPKVKDAHELRQRLDLLEGHPNHYIRSTVRVLTPTARVTGVQAFVYKYQFDCSRYDMEPTGDYNWACKFDSAWDASGLGVVGRR